MVAASGDRLLDSAGEEAYESLFEHATLVTPNADEAEVLTGIEHNGRRERRVGRKTRSARWVRTPRS